MIVYLHDVILSMPHLFEASAFDANSDEKYSANFLIDKTDAKNLDAVKAGINAALEKKFRDKAATAGKAIVAAGKMWALRDGDGKVNKNSEPVKGYAGRLFVSAKNKHQPPVYDKDGVTPITKDDGRLYPGCIVSAKIDIVAGEKPSNQVYAYLQGIQLRGDGERLGGGVAAPGDFAPVPGAQKGGFDPTAGGTTAKGVETLY